MPDMELRYYACGETDHDIGQLVYGHPHEKRTFPTGVFLFQHSSGERVLFDTGYGPAIAGGLKGSIYKRLLPPRITENALIDRQLRADGIHPDTIGHVVLSHLHPDHIGGAQYFPNATFVLAQKAAANIEKPQLLDGVMPGLLPVWFRDTSKLILDDGQLSKPADAPVGGHDLFGDGSFLVTELPGHARGHIGALVMSRVLLAGDASWLRNLLPYAGNLRPLPRLITDDMAAYQSTAKKLLSLQTDGITIALSHDTYDSKVI